MCMVNRGIFFNFKKRFTLILCGPYYGTHVEIREELVSIGSLLPSGFQGSNPGHQSWWQMCVSAEPSHWPSKGKSSEDAW